MIPVYIAGASREHKRVAMWARQLELSGLVRLDDRWWESAAEWTGRDSEWSRSQQIDIASAHEERIRSARVLWLLWPQEPSFGALYELGYAAALRDAGAGRPWLVVTGRGCSRSVYTGNADYRDASDDLGALEVLRICRELRA